MVALKFWRVLADHLLTNMNAPRQFRLLTRSDFDGLVCAILLKSLGILESIQFAHPKDVQDGKIEVNENDILTNLPYVKGCHLCFDHHSSEGTRAGEKRNPRHILEISAQSAARVLYNYYGGQAAFPGIADEMMRAVDKADSANFTREEILDPQGWVLMSFLMDARTGLGRFREFRVANHQLMMDLVDYCGKHSVEKTLDLPDVRERVQLYREHRDLFADQLRRCTTVLGNLACLDLRNEETIYVGNRFMVYALFPECNISMHVLWGVRKQNVVLALGKSILDRSCSTNIGDLLFSYGGGGHEGAGTCQIEIANANAVKLEIIARINAEDQGRLIMESQKTDGAGGGGRTLIPSERCGILSPVRLPVPPLQPSQL